MKTLKLRENFYWTGIVGIWYNIQFLRAESRGQDYSF